MPPHNALLLLEILEHIFDHILLPENHHVAFSRPIASRNPAWWQAAADLSHAAQVCKAFHEPALRALWRGLPNFLPLVQLLSCCTRIQIDDNYLDDNEFGYLSQRPVYTYVVLDRVNPGEWSRFQYYASLVRCCHINEVDPRAKAVVDHTVFAYLLRKNKGRPLLPFLEHLAWYQVRSSDLSLSSLATPSLRKLQCYVSPPSRYFSLAAGAQSAVDSLLGNVLGYAGQLHELSVIGLSRWCTLESPKKCLQLRALHGLMLHPCSTPTSAELATLARIPALQYLHLYFDESILKKKKTGGGGEMCTFRHLERLKFTGYTLGMTAFLNNSALPALESLVISLFTFAKLQQVHNLLHSVRLAEVAPRLRHLTLKKEHLQLEFDYPDEADGTPLLAILDPLFALPCLHRLEISLADMSIRVSDDDVLAITSQLKELRVLVLDIPKTPLATRPSLLALVHVARNCRHLHNLRLPPVVHRGGAPPVNDLPPHELSALDTGHWDVDSVSLNAFLTTLFPKLKL